MIDVLLIGQKRATLSELSGLLSLHGDVKVSEINSEAEALEITSGIQYQLIIVDDQVENSSGIEFAKQLIAANPLLNCAIVSSLSGKDFHEATEGLGVLAKIPRSPSAEDIEKLLDSLRRILGLLG